MVRDAIARTAGARHVPAPSLAPGAAEPDPDQAFRANVAFVRLQLPRGSDTDGACLIEPTVRCSHCGYCQSFGH